MLVEIDQSNELLLYNYIVSIGETIPFCYPVSFENWQKSMFADCDYDGKILFSDLKTYIIMKEMEIKGFIQFGLTNFIFGENGKDYSKSYAVVRNVYYEHETDAYVLMNKEISYFYDLGYTKPYAFFHFFGMSCYARQGKLFQSNFFIEKVLNKYGFIKEHENVFYSKILNKAECCDVLDILLKSDDNMDSVSFIIDGKEIGGCELNILVNSDICFLKRIYIDNQFANQGLGSKCMNKLFFELEKREIKRIDTDTADNNFIAKNIIQRWVLKIWAECEVTIKAIKTRPDIMTLFSHNPY